MRYFINNYEDLILALSQTNDYNILCIESSIVLQDDIILEDKSNTIFEFSPGCFIDGYSITFYGNTIIGYGRIFGDNISVQGWISNDYVKPEWWGTYNDRIGDDSIAINKAIQFAIKYPLNQRGTCVVKLKQLPYYIQNPILVLKEHIDNNLGFYYSTCHLEGIAKGCDYGTRIVTLYSDKPGIIIQGGRGTKINDIHVQSQGYHDGYCSLMLLGDLGSMLNKNAYLSDNLRDERYSSYGGVVIDCFTYGTPIESQYPTLSSYYKGNAASSNITIRDCKVNGFILGLGLSTGYNSDLGDSIVIDNCNLSVNKNAIAIGQSQTRGIHISNIHANFLECYIDTLRYGAGMASSFHETNAMITHCRWLFITTVCRGTSSSNNLYGEVINSIGIFRNETLSRHIPFVFNNIYLKLCSSYNLNLYHSDFTIFCTRGEIVFDGGYIGMYDNRYHEFTFAGGAEYIFNNISVDGAIVNSKTQYTNVIFRYSNMNIDSLFTGCKFMNILTCLGSITKTSNGEAEITTSYINSVQVGDYLYDLAPRYIYNEYYNTNDTNCQLKNFIVGKVKSIQGNKVILNEVPFNYPDYAEKDLYVYRYIRNDNLIGLCNTSHDTYQLSNIKNIDNFNIGDPIILNDFTNGHAYRIMNKVGNTLSIDRKLVYNLNNVELYRLDTERGKKFFEIRNSGGRVPIIKEGLSKPISGIWFKDDVVMYVGTQNENNYIKGWLCIESGEPGIWNEIN